MEKKHDLAKWLAGEMSEQELQDFKQSPEFDAYQKIAKYSSEFETPAFDSEPVLQEIVNLPKKEAKVMSIKKWIFSAAAILIIAFGCFFFMKTQTISEQAIAGNITEFSLPDQSLVSLNSDSKVQYKSWNWDQNRNIKLQGEAFFKVAKGKRFTVKTDLGTVIVIGTQFNIKSRGTRFEVECFEGRVKVQYKGKTKLLNKGKIMVCDHGDLLDALPTNTSTPSWMQHKIRVISEGLPTILSEIERIYAVNIQVKSDIPNQSFSGFLPSDNLATAMEILSKTYNFSYKNDIKNKVILISK